MAAERAGQVRRRVIYSGRVQGVFFRATSAELARSFDVVGYVRNLPDGTVVLEAQGPVEEVEAFLLAVERRYAGNITGTDVEELPLRDGETRFEIRYV